MGALALGWVSGAAWSNRTTLADSVSHEAAETSHETPHATPADVHGEVEAGHGESTDHAEHSDHAEHATEDLLAAKALVPTDRDVPFYPTVIALIAGLFVAAVVLGIPALKIRGPLPPDPADSHHDDAHSHDDHAHAAH